MRRPSHRLYLPYPLLTKEGKKRGKFHSPCPRSRHGKGSLPMPVYAEASFIGQYFPGFFFGNRHRNHRHHAGPRAAVPDNPEQFTIFSSLVEFAISEITRTGTQAPADRTISQAGFSMTRHTGAFSFIQDSSFFNDLGRSRFRRTEGRDQFPGPYSFTHGHPGT